MSYYLLTQTYNPNIYKNIFFKKVENEESNQKTLISFSLYDNLCKFKKQIENNYDHWDNIKKYTNPYEFIHTLIPNQKISISKMKPLSRSFYKMIELCKIFKIFEKWENKQIDTFHLAEGPGGFIEASVYVRNNKNDNYYGMTLVNDDPGCPGWRKSKLFLDNNSNVNIIYGEDNNGDLLSLENFKYCYKRWKNKMELITGDGGIDVSSDFNKQEKLVSKLIIAELMYAIVMQKEGGSYILKIFDIFSKLTLDILFILSNLYEEVYIVKPYTSRLANSEKYIYCNNFLVEDSEKFYEVFINNFEKLNNYDNIETILDINFDYYFLNRIEEINAILGQQQLENIINTINLINNRNNFEKLECMKKNNIQKCIVWCEKYDIPFNKIYLSNNIFLNNTNNIAPTFNFSSLQNKNIVENSNE